MELFELGKIGKLQTKNRIVMAPMGLTGFTEPDGRISDRGIDYYVARAKGGVGLITTGSVAVEQEIENDLYDGLWSFRPRIDREIYVSQWSVLANALHDYGAKLSIQLTAGAGRMASPHMLRSQGAVAPSAQP